MPLLSSILTSGVLGTITGILGNAVNSFINYKTQQLKNKHEEKMAELDMKAMIAEAREAAKIKKVEVEGEIEKSANEALESSYDFLNNDLFNRSYMNKLMGSKIGRFFGGVISVLFAIVDFMKHLARPLITYYMLAISTVLTWLCYKILIAAQAGITTVQAFALFQNAILVLLYLTTTCVGWWFADRRVGKFMNRLNDGNYKDNKLADKFMKGLSSK